MADDEDRKDPDEPAPVAEAFDASEYNEVVGLHRVALAGLRAMGQCSDFDPAATHAIILLQDGQISVVAPLNYPANQPHVVIADLLQHVESLARKFGMPTSGQSTNGGPHDH